MLCAKNERKMENVKEVYPDPAGSARKHNKPSLRPSDYKRSWIM
jgi:hypothetical protein